MEEVRQAVGESEARQRMVLTWRQSDSFLAGQSLYPLLDNRLEYTETTYFAV